MIRILLVDDHSIVATGLKISLTQRYSFCKIDTAKDGDEAFKLVKERDYDLMILDINMPGTDTSSLIYQLLSIKSHLKILIFSMYPEEFYAKRFLKMGVKGYLSKEASKEEILSAVQTVLDGKIYISEKVAIRFSEMVLGVAEPGNAFESLTERELEVTRHLCQGMRIIEICNLMNLHQSTIGTHKSKIFEKLRVKNILELKELAQLHNII